MPLCDYLSVCLCVFTWQKIYQAGGPATVFSTLFGLIGANVTALGCN